MESLKEKIRDVPDFPKPGVVFKDITPLLADGPSFRAFPSPSVRSARRNPGPGWWP